MRIIDDRFRFDIGVHPTLLHQRAKSVGGMSLEGMLQFFQLFETFKGYVEFFLLNDLVDERGNVKFYLPFDEFQSPPQFKDARGLPCLQEQSRVVHRIS